MYLGGASAAFQTSRLRKRFPCPGTFLCHALAVDDEREMQTQLLRRAAAQEHTVHENFKILDHCAYLRVDGKRQADLLFRQRDLVLFDGVIHAVVNVERRAGLFAHAVRAFGFSLDDKRAPVAENDIPDIIERFRNLDKEADRKRTDKSFMVPKKDIVDNAYDLSINKYKEVEYVPVEYPPTSEIMANIRGIEEEIHKEMDELHYDCCQSSKPNACIFTLVSGLNVILYIFPLISVPLKLPSI